MKFSSKFRLNIFIFATLMGSTLVSAGTYYNDVNSGDWFQPYVDELTENQVFQMGPAFPDFRPEDQMSRAEFAKSLALSLNLLDGYKTPNTPSYRDVPIDTWYYPSVMALKDAGIMTGDTDEQGIFTGTFRPEASINRAEVARALVKGFQLPESKGASHPFSDVNEEDWFNDEVNLLYAWSIINGYSDGTYKPQKEALRSEVAKMLAEAIKLTPTPPPAPLEPPPEPLPPQEPVTDPVVPEVPAETEEEVFISHKTELRPRIIADGEMQLAATYSFQASKEGFYIQTLTIANDLVGENIGDEPKGSFAVDKIILKYPNKEGFLRTATAPLSLSGKTTFGALEFFAPKNSPAPLEIYLQTKPFSEVGEPLSGETIRLGVQDINNTHAEFRAIGEFSGAVIQGNPSFSHFENYKMVVRKGGAPLLKTIPVSEALFSGENELIRFALQAPQSSSGLARITFELSVNDAANADLTLSDFKLRDGSGVVDEAVIYDATGNQDLSVGSLGNGLSQIIVSFNEQQAISSNAEYSLTATVHQAASSDAVYTRIKRDDTPLSGLTASFQENTGKIYSEGDSATGIFTSASDFSQIAGANLNLLWSDRSGEPHQYPAVSGGLVQTDTGSADWTNGYLLNMDAVKTQVLSR